MPVVALTATIPGREELLAECIRAVYAQTVPVLRHIIIAQTPADGVERPVDLANALNAGVQSVYPYRLDWVAFCDDDNLWLPDHIEGLLATAEEHPDGDVIYHPSTGGYMPFRDTNDWSSEKTKAELNRTNWIDPNGAMVRYGSIEAAGGLRSRNFTPWTKVGEDEFVGGYLQTGTSSDDWDFWMRLAINHSLFRTSRRQTWTYRGGPWRRGSDDFFDVVLEEEGGARLRTRRES